MNAEPSAEPQLNADFAARVLVLADRILARRRRIRWIAGASAACVGTIVALAWIKFAAVPRAPTPSPNLVAAAGPVPDVGYSRNEAGDPLSLLFPDAEPVARFAAENGGDDDAGSLFDGQE